MWNVGKSSATRFVCGVSSYEGSFLRSLKSLPFEFAFVFSVMGHLCGVFPNWFRLIELKAVQQLWNQRILYAFGKGKATASAGAFAYSHMTSTYSLGGLRRRPRRSLSFPNRGRSASGRGRKKAASSRGWGSQWPTRPWHSVAWSGRAHACYWCGVLQPSLFWTFLTAFHFLPATHTHTQADR